MPCHIRTTSRGQMRSDTPWNRSASDCSQWWLPARAASPSVLEIPAAPNKRLKDQNIQHSPQPSVPCCTESQEDQIGGSGVHSQSDSSLRHQRCLISLPSVHCFTYLKSLSICWSFMHLIFRNLNQLSKTQAMMKFTLSTPRNDHVAMGVNAVWSAIYVLIIV